MRREPSSEHFFQIRAESIVRVDNPEEYDRKNTFVIFKPEADTLERLRNLPKGANLGAIALIDKWDDGEEDILESMWNHEIISFELGSDRGMKSSSWILVTKVHNGG